MSRRDFTCQTLWLVCTGLSSNVAQARQEVLRKTQAEVFELSATLQRIVDEAACVALEKFGEKGLTEKNLRR